EIPTAPGMTPARGRFVPPWGLGFDAGLDGMALHQGAALSDAQRSLLAALPPLLLGFRDHDAPVAAAVIAQLQAAGLQVAGAAIPMQTRRVDFSAYGLFVERIRQRGSGQDALPLLSMLPAAVARFGHQLVELEVLLELAAGQDSRLAREKLPGDLEAELLRAAPAIPLLFGPRSQREQVVLMSHRVRGLVDETTRRVVSDESQAWLLPKAPSP
ncbi:MAG: hypothetical protein ACO3JL_00600, partial [Myxococcota bacterium]